MRALIPEGRFFEVHVDCPIEVCIHRDPNGLYGHALKGEIRDFTGISASYEPPLTPEIVVHTDLETPAETVAEVLLTLERAGLLPPARGE